MHAQATSGSVAVSTLDEIACVRHIPSLSAEATNIIHCQLQQSPPSTPTDSSCTGDSKPVNSIQQDNKDITNIVNNSQDITNLLNSSQDIANLLNCSQDITNLVNNSLTNLINTNLITTIITPKHSSTNSNELDDDPSNQNRSSWVVKNFSKLNSSSNSSSRGSLAQQKGKGGGGGCCTRRRLLDEEGYIRRAACICVNQEETKVLLVSSKKDPCVWLVPGGGLEAGEDAVTAAKREVWEEAGLLGHIARYLGLFESIHHSGMKKHRTAVYIFVVTEEHTDFPEATLGRRRQWFTMEEALMHLARNRPLQSAYLQLLIMSKLKVVAAT